MLKEEGYLQLPPFPEDKCDSIVKQLQELTFKGRYSSHEIKGVNITDAKSNVYEVMNQQSIIGIPEVKELSAIPKILAIVKEYLDAEPIQTQAACWWTCNYSSVWRHYCKCAQAWHRDATYDKFIKMFLYLNDVTMENGPHAYIPDSRERGTSGKRLAEDFIDENYRNQGKSEVFLTGKKGSLHLVDTTGLHRGMPVKTGYRLVVQLEWANDPTNLVTKQVLKYV